jgi:hypothetical protein
MLRQKYGIQCYRNDPEVNRIAQDLYSALQREYFGLSPPTFRDIREISLEVDPRLRPEVLSKMLSIRYKIDC